MTGSTQSSDFPTTAGAYDTSFQVTTSIGVDAFVSKLNGDLTSLLASTILGGVDPDTATCLAIDSSGSVFVVGYIVHENGISQGGFARLSHHTGCLRYLFQ